MTMVRGKQIISTKQLFAILFLGLMNHGYVSISRWITEVAHQDAWISTFLGGFIAFVLLNIILLLMKRFPDKTFIQISDEVLGKYLGKIPGIIFLIFLLFFTALSLYLLVSLVSAWLLPKTPIDVIIISILLLQIYLTREGIKVLGRFQEMIMVIVLLGMPITFLPYFIYQNHTLLMPIGGTGVVTILKGALPAFYTFFTFFSLLILYPYVRKDASHKEIVKASNMSILVVTILKTFYVFGSIAVFGEKEIQFFLYPLLEYVKLLVFPVIERVEFMMIFLWLFMMFSGTVTTFYMANLTAEQVINVEGYKNTGLIIAIPIYFLTRLSQNIAESLSLFRLEGAVLSIVLLATIAFVFGLSFILQKGGENA